MLDRVAVFSKECPYLHRGLKVDVQAKCCGMLERQVQSIGCFACDVRLIVPDGLEDALEYGLVKRLD